MPVLEPQIYYRGLCTKIYFYMIFFLKKVKESVKMFELSQCINMILAFIKRQLS